MVLQVVPWRDTRCQVITTIFQTFQVPRVSVVEFLGDQRFQWSGGCYTLPKTNVASKSPWKWAFLIAPKWKRKLVWTKHPFSGAKKLAVSFMEGILSHIIPGVGKHGFWFAPPPSIRTTDEDSVPWLVSALELLRGPDPSNIQLRCKGRMKVGGADPCCLVETSVSFGVVFWIPKGAWGIQVFLSLSRKNAKKTLKFSPYR